MVGLPPRGRDWAGADPPLPGDIKNISDELKFIQCHTIFARQLPSGGEPITIKKRYEMSQYNSRWLSIDVRGRNFVLLDGLVDHRNVARGAASAAVFQQSETGACCLPDGSCLNTDERTCVAEGGTFMGAGTNCRTTDCTQPPPQTQACCLPDGSCDNLTEQQCLDSGGTPQGAGTNCTMVDCRWCRPMLGCLVAHWRLDETTGTIAHDSAGDNHGTLFGNPLWQRTAGKIRGALRFDGVDDYVDCGNDPSLNITGDVTVTAWIRLSETSIDQKVAGNQDGSNGGYKMTVHSNDRVEFEIRTAANAAVLNRDVAGGTALQVGVWYHVTGVYSQGNYIRTYVNGVLDRELITTAVIGSSTGTLKLGCEPFDVSSYLWNGLMDDVRVYNCALSEDEIQQLFRGDAALALVGHWKFDEGAGTVVTDSSGYGNDGTFEGNPQWVAGYNGGALEFNGDDWVNFGDILDISDAITIACWVNPAGLSGDNGWVARWDAYAFKSSGSSLRFTTPGILDYTANNTVLKSGEWQHVAVTFVPNQTGGAIFYLDGVEAQRMDSTGMNAGGGPFGIGNNQWSEFYEGLIDDVRVYNCALCEDGIQQLFRGDASALLAHWKLDETSGIIASDSSGRGNHGTLYGNPTWQPAAGLVGGALEFDGDGDYVQIPKIGNSVEFTYAMWLAQNQIGSNLRALINHKDWIYGSVHLQLRDGHPQFGINEAITPAGDLDAWDYTLAVDEWHHVAVVKSATELLIYVDGQEAARRELTMSDTVILGDGFIGAWVNPDWGETRYFNGLLDDVRIYNRALGEDEINALHLGNGDAVRILDPIAPAPGAGWMSGEPIMFEDTSWDTALELMTNQPDPHELGTAALNNNGIVDFKDLEIIAHRWLTPKP